MSTTNKAAAAWQLHQIADKAGLGPSCLRKHVGRAQDLRSDCSPSRTPTGREVETEAECTTPTAQPKGLLWHLHLSLHPGAPCSPHHRNNSCGHAAACQPGWMAGDEKVLPLHPSCSPKSHSQAGCQGRILHQPQAGIEVLKVAPAALPCPSPLPTACLNGEGHCCSPAPAPAIHACKVPRAWDSPVSSRNRLQPWNGGCARRLGWAPEKPRCTFTILPAPGVFQSLETAPPVWRALGKAPGSGLSLLG